MKGSVRVFIRARPCLFNEITCLSYDINNNSQLKSSNYSHMFEDIENRSIIIENSVSSKKFEFYKAFKEHTTQQEIFNEIEPLIDSFLDG